MLAGDVYAHPSHAGRGGLDLVHRVAAGWMYRAGLESILGLRRRGETFEIDPCIPPAWPGFRITWRFGATRYEIAVANPERRARGVAEASLDGAPVDPRAIPLKDDGGRHELKVCSASGSWRPRRAERRQSRSSLPAATNTNRIPVAQKLG